MVLWCLSEVGVILRTFSRGFFARTASHICCLILMSFTYGSRLWMSSFISHKCVSEASSWSRCLSIRKQSFNEKWGLMGSSQDPPKLTQEWQVHHGDSPSNPSPKHIWPPPVSAMKIEVFHLLWPHQKLFPFTTCYLDSGSSGASAW